jgi:hypothetical protein
VKLAAAMQPEILVAGTILAEIQYRGEVHRGDSPAVGKIATGNMKGLEKRLHRMAVPIEPRGHLARPLGIHVHGWTLAIQTRGQVTTPPIDGEKRKRLISAIKRFGRSGSAAPLPPCCAGTVCGRKYHCFGPADQGRAGT